MARATFVKKARKDVPGTDIKAGDSYYWWKFMSGGRGGSKRYSKTQPKPSQLTNSAFWGPMYGIQETEAPQDYADLESALEDVKSQLEELRDENQEKFDNLPESFQAGSTGELLQGRIDAVEEVISELENISILTEEDVTVASDDELDEKEKEKETEEEKEERHAQALQEKLDELWGEIDSALNNISCD